MLTFTHATRASQGARPYQEDAAAVWPGDGRLVPKDHLPKGLDLVAVLADGMGGHAAGDVASNLICEIFLKSFDNDGPVPERLGKALAAANTAVHRKSDSNPSLSGMGATLVGVVIGTGAAQWISVGDSPFYLLRGTTLVRLNQDHSLAPLLDQMVADGKMSADEAQADPRRHYLRSAVTGEELDLIDLSEDPLELKADDMLIVASDGLLTLDETRIAGIAHAYAKDGAEKVAEALLRAVENVGAPHQDNTTVVVIQAAKGRG